jgi:hypothetical protein
MADPKIARGIILVHKGLSIAPHTSKYLVHLDLLNTCINGGSSDDDALLLQQIAIFMKLAKPDLIRQYLLKHEYTMNNLCSM